MAFRPDIVAGQAVILVNIQDNIDAQLRQIRAKLRRFSNSISDLGGDLFRGGLLGTIGAALPVKDFMNFQDQMLFLQTKLRATDETMSDLERTVRELGKTTSFTSREVAQGATELAKAEFSARQIQDSLQAVLDLGRGAQLPLEDSASIIANTIKSFGLEADQAARVAGNFIAAARLGTIEVDNLKESLKESLGTFRGYGASLEETLALFSTLSFASLKGTKAGTSLNTMFLNLNQSSKMLKENLDIDVFDEGGTFRGVVPVLADLDRELRKLTDENRMKLIQNAFNIRGGRAQMGLFIQGVGEIRKRVEAITEASGEARWAAEKLDSALGGVWRRSLSALQELSITLGSVLEGPLTTFGENMRLAFNNLNELVKANPQLAKSFLLIPPAVMAVGVGMLSLGWILNKIASLLTPVIMLNDALFAGLNKIVTANLKVVKSFASIHLLFSLRALNNIRRFVLSLNGLTIALEAILIFGPSIPPVARALDALGRAFKALFSGIAETFRNVKPALDAFIFGLKQLVTGNITIGLAFIKGSFAQIATVIRTNLTVAWDNFIAEIEPGVRVIKGVFKGIIATIKAVVESIKAIVGKAWETGSIVISADGAMLDQLRQIFSLQNMKLLFQGIVSIIGSLTIKMLEAAGHIQVASIAIQGAIAKLDAKAVGTRVIEGVFGESMGGSIIGGFGKIVSGLSVVQKWIMDGFKIALDFVQKFGEALNKWTKFIISTLRSFIEGINKLLQRYLEFLTPVFTGFKVLFDLAVKAFLPAVKGIDLLALQVDKLMNPLRDFGNGLIQLSEIIARLYRVAFGPLSSFSLKNPLDKFKLDGTRPEANSIASQIERSRKNTRQDIDELDATFRDLINSLEGITDPIKPTLGAKADAAAANEMATALGAAAKFIGSIQSGAGSLKGFLADPFGGKKASAGKGMLRSLRDALATGRQDTTLTAAELGKKSEAVLRDVRAEAARDWEGWGNVPKDARTRLLNFSNIIDQMAKAEDKEGLQAFVARIKKESTIFGGGFDALLSGQAESTQGLFGQLGSTLGKELFTGLDSATGGFADFLAKHAPGFAIKSKEMREQMKPMELAAKSIVGSFGTTRGGMLATQKLEEKQTALLQTIADNTTEMKDAEAVFP